MSNLTFAHHPHLYEALFILTLGLGYWVRQRRQKATLWQSAVIASAAWLGEDTVISAYHFYAYSPHWALRLHHVPVVVVLIWPLVILYAEDVGRDLGLIKHAKSLSGSLTRSLATNAFWIFVLVTFDAALIEILSVRAGLWSWTLPGYLDVPMIGILGWGLFAWAIWLFVQLLDAQFSVQKALKSEATRGANVTGANVKGASVKGASVTGASVRFGASVVFAVVLTHLQLLGLWWGVFRWMWRDSLGLGFAYAIATVSVLLLPVLLLRRVRLGHALNFQLGAMRLCAASFFFLFALAFGDTAHQVHLLAAASLYFSVFSFRRDGTAAQSTARSATL